MKIKNKKLVDIKASDEAKVICSLAQSQVIQSRHANLFFQIFKRAVFDAFGVDKTVDVDRGAALLYLRDDMLHGEAIGIDRQWICELINKSQTLKGCFDAN